MSPTQVTDVMLANWNHAIFDTSSGELVVYIFNLIRILSGKYIVIGVIFLNPGFVRLIMSKLRAIAYIKKQ